METDPRSRAAEVLCVLNRAACSGKAAGQLERLRAASESLGHKLKIVRLGDASTEQALKAAIARQDGVVLAGGGDGTINWAANRLVETQTALGVLPLGTLNHFSKDLGIPQSLEEAVQIALTGERTKVDVGDVNGRCFVNNSSIGLYPGLVREREALQRRGLGKWLAFARALAVSVWTYRPIHVEMIVKGRNLSAVTPLVLIGNNEYELSLPNLGGRSSLTDGLLWVLRAPPAGWLKLAGLALKSLAFPSPGAAPELFHTDALTIKSRARSLHVAVDGEVTRMASPLRYKIRPKALTVMVPGRTST